MPKKIRNLFYKNLTFEKHLEAHKRARKHKAYRKDVIKFELNLENNLINLLNSLKNKTYKLGNYYTFRIFEPKERIIQALPYIDRIVHQWYVEEFIKPFVVPKFISTSFACLENKGTHKAALELQKQMRIIHRNIGSFWILKCDISKFFYRINPNILFSLMKKYIEDPDLLQLTHLLIFNGQDVGIPIGNYTSQFFANIYLNELDQYIKRTLKIKYLCRYMDDFVLLLPSKNDCIETKKKIETFLDTKLKLELNAKTKYYPYKMGVDFCGYRIFTTHMLLRNSSKKKIKKNLKNWNKKYNNHSLNLDLTMAQLNSWLGHSSHCNSFKLQQKILNSCDFLYNTRAFEKEEEMLKENYNSQYCP